jgi:hypothetical protein
MGKDYVRSIQMIYFSLANMDFKEAQALSRKVLKPDLRLLVANSQGRDLAQARDQQHSLLGVAKWFGASLVALVLLPLHLLAKKLVYSKILEALNIKEVRGRSSAALGYHSLE